MKIESGMSYTRVLPCVGGPLDGQKRAVAIVLPFLDGGVECAAFTERGATYIKRRGKWRYVKEEK